MVHLATDEEIFELLQTLPGGTLGTGDAFAMANVVHIMSVTFPRRRGARVLHPFASGVINDEFLARPGWTGMYEVCVRAFLGAPDEELALVLTRYEPRFSTVNFQDLALSLIDRRAGGTGGLRMSVITGATERLDALYRLVTEVTHDLLPRVPLRRPYP